MPIINKTPLSINFSYSKNKIPSIKPILRFIFLMASALHLASQIGILVNAKELKTCEGKNTEDKTAKAVDYSKNKPESYDSLQFPYLKSDEFTCSDLEKYMTQQDQSTIKLTRNVPKKIGVITDCNIKFQEGVTNFELFTESIQTLLDNFALSEPDSRDLIKLLKNTFEFILENKDKTGPRFILVDLIKYYQLMNCEESNETCIISDSNNDIPEELIFSNPSDQFHLGQTDSSEFIITQNSGYSIGKSAILFSLAKAIPYLKIKLLHKDLDYKKMALDSSGHVLSIIRSFQTENMFNSPAFGPIIHDKEFLSKIRHDLVSKVTTFKRSGRTTTTMTDALTNYFNQNDGATMFMNHAGIKMLKLFAKKHGIDWNELAYVKISKSNIQSMSQDIPESYFSVKTTLKTLRLG